MSEWVWMPHAAHFILGDKCRFVLSTYLGNGYIVSTVGELWQDQAVRRISAEVYDPEWYLANRDKKGDNFDSVYMEKFGYGDLGYDRKYETMVFKAVKNAPSQCEACQYVIESGQSLDFSGYTNAKEAYNGHMEMCKKWSAKS